jgi:hypothetical protein
MADLQDEIDLDRFIQATTQRYAELVDRYNDLLRFCMALPLLVRARVGDSSNVVEIHQLYLDQLAEHVAKVRERL